MRRNRTPPRSLIPLLCSLLASLAPTPAAAQDADVPPAFPDSASIRVWARDSGLWGTRMSFVGWTDSTMLAVRQSTDERFQVPVSAIRRIDLRVGEHGRARTVALTVGTLAALGYGAGAIVALASGSESTAWIGFGIGAGVGALFGARRTADRWERVDLPEGFGRGGGGG